MTRFVVVSAALALTAASLDAQATAAPPKWADTISAAIEKAQLAGDSAGVAAAAALAARVAIAYPKDGLILHYEGYALFREALITQRKSDASALFEQAHKILSRSLETRPLPETHMLLSSIDGQLIARNPSRGMELGMASQSSTQAAVASGPKNPRVWLMRGQGAIFTPPEYGGGLDKAKEYIERSIQLFATDAPKPGEPAWGKAEAYAWLGQVYQKSGDKARAASLYKQALGLSPDYAYAKMLAASLDK